MMQVLNPYSTVTLRCTSLAPLERAWWELSFGTKQRSVCLIVKELWPFPPGEFLKFVEWVGKWLGLLLCIQPGKPSAVGVKWLELHGCTLLRQVWYIVIFYGCLVDCDSLTDALYTQAGLVQSNILWMQLLTYVNKYYPVNWVGPSYEPGNY